MFTLSDSGLRSVRWLILALMPLIPAIFGAVIWWQRRA
jgi:uncharacterized iron-regulated membrane protein